ncbi:DEAD-box helicase Dbp80-like [Sitodiplosis mosellana]|uniref:DEAD-box helicase Dbp80-like n=1 Tax=Sitodiplosis mosellana TaxID=263140 RepID=UPI002444A477|nr:DEAD-box helicase Dbp80-like [Sitodiplosis mosellana]
MAHFKAQRVDSFRNKPVYRNVKTFVETALKEAKSIVDAEKTFEDCIADPLIANTVKGMGFNFPSLFQYGLLSQMNDDSQNLVVVSKPGTGKTVAVSIGVLNYVNRKQNYPQVLYLCTTHEAAVQTAKQLTGMAIGTEIKVGTALKNSNVTLGHKLNCHVLVGTPKEMVSFKIMRHFNIEQISLCVFDDADTIVTTKLIKDHIIANLTQSRKVLMSSKIQFNINFAKPYAIKLDTTNVNVKQCYTFCEDDGEKIIAVLAVNEILTTLKIQGIIFFETGEMAEQYGNILKLKGVSVALLHRSLSVTERNDELEQFKCGHRIFAVATNLLARGVNLPNTSTPIDMNIELVGLATSVDKGMEGKNTEKEKPSTATMVHRTWRCPNCNAKGVGPRTLRDHVLRNGCNAPRDKYLKSPTRKE